jgi:hypothetical protein
MSGADEVSGYVMAAHNCYSYEEGDSLAICEQLS